MRAGRITTRCLLLVFLAFGPHIAHAEEKLTIQLDWSDDRELEMAALKLQDGGLLTIPLLYVDRTPVAMLGDDIAVPDQGKPVLVEVGTPNILEGPLYSFFWPPFGDQPEAVLVMSADLAAYKPANGTDKFEGLLSYGIEATQVSIIATAPGHKTLRLNAKPYAALTLLTSQNHDAIKSTPGAFVSIFQTDRETGKIREPLAQYAKAFKEPVTNNAIRRKFGELYAERVDASWFDDALKFFEAEPKEALMIRSVPTASDIFVSGTRYTESTDARVEVLKRKWGEIFIRRKTYQPCQVDVYKIEPPRAPGEPSVFSCKLKKL